ncbi:TerD family protein [Streptantibioticus rubrisoli]|uniref:TerD domain-containing protein n=1 Tax=Streptantibioticus rubrisoli TaxID=1387313 RepID=A0ABT1PBU1_9ACTN|nr:TerD family protein [Streptantibioticus rubrisoli]MCQ4041913.1 TerD domain-containing protein [Streptantibioticus rubrisoli]
MSMPKGANVPVPARPLRVEFARRTNPGAPRTEVHALLLADSRADVVTPGRAHPSRGVRHEGGRAVDGERVDGLLVDLTVVEPGVDRIVLVASADGGTFGQLAVRVRLTDPVAGGELASFECADATVESALVLGELYRRAGQWRFRAVGQGYDTGLDGLAADFGISANALVPPEPQAAPEPASAPPAALAQPLSPPAPPVRLAKVTLTKDAPSVSLTKQGGTSGAMRVNLNWQTRQQPKGWLRKAGLVGSHSTAIDLDLCALYELTDGTRGVVQALGNAFGALNRPPYIQLDGDDRTGAVDSGENLTINLDHQRAFRRILVFVTIYEGARSFAGLHATTTLTPRDGAPIEFFLDECTVPSTVCALALISNEGGELVVRREARYLVPRPGVSPQRTVDQAYGWGMNWTPGRKH